MNPDRERIKTAIITKDNIPELARLTKWTEGELYAKYCAAKARSSQAVILLSKMNVR